jgi:phytoene desaturase
MVFLGSSPKNAPALYSIMSHVDLNLGVQFPRGGMTSLVKGIVRLAQELGVQIRTDTEVTGLVPEKRRVTKIESTGGAFDADLVLVNADYHHAEMDLLPEAYRSYGRDWWNRKVLAPSMFIIYLGLGKKLKSVVHHNLYFSDPWDGHFDAIFRNPSWPEDPCYYVSCASYDDPTVAPENSENIFFLVPVAAGLDDNDELREQYSRKILSHFEQLSGETLSDSIRVKRIFTQRDFESDYHAFKGTALGLAHTLFQTAVFRPALRSRILPNLYFAGQYTHPGVGVPMTLIAAQVAAERMRKEQSIKP